MRAQGCRIHIWRIIIIRDGAVVTSTGLPADLEAGGLVCPVQCLAVAAAVVGTLGGGGGGGRAYA
jgi:hypothetical protein